MTRTRSIWLYAFFAVIAAAEIFALSVMGNEPGLTLVNGDRDRDWYVNTGTLVTPAPGTISFWDRIVPTKDSALSSKIAEVVKKAGKNPERVVYLQTLREVDCPADRSKVLGVLFYDRKDRIVLSSTPKAAKEIIALADAGGSFGRTVCDMSSGADAGAKGAELAAR